MVALTPRGSLQARSFLHFHCVYTFVCRQHSSHQDIPAFGTVNISTLEVLSPVGMNAWSWCRHGHNTQRSAA